MKPDERYTWVESVMAGAFVTMTCASMAALWLAYKNEQAEKQRSQRPR